MPVPLDLLLEGFAQALTPANVLYALIGCLVGTLIGVLPGIGPTSGIAILLPLSTVLPPTSAIIMMAAVYYGAMYGGSTTAIVVNIPGEASSVPTAIDGYEMAKQGRAGTALGIAAISSFVAGTLSLVGLTFFAPMLANVALSFGPPEYFALMVMSLALTISLSGRAVVKGAVALVIGLAVATIGLDPLTGLRRLTFGSVTLMAGINFVSVVIGLFAISEFMVNVEQSAQHLYDARIKNWLPTLAGAAGLQHHHPARDGHRLCAWSAARVQPGGDDLHRLRRRKALREGSVAVWKGSDRRSSGRRRREQRDVERRLRPAVRVRCAGEPAPGGTAGALLMYGLQPGPRLFQESPQLVWTVIASMYVGNVILLVLNLPLVGVWARIATIPFPILGPIILLSAVIGAYSIRYLLFDVWMAILFGIIGYALRKTGYPLAPIALACVLGPTLETSLKQSLILSGGSLTIFATRPLTAIILLVTCVMVGRTLWGLRGKGAAASGVRRVGRMCLERSSRREQGEVTTLCYNCGHNTGVHHADRRRSGAEVELERVSQARKGRRAVDCDRSWAGDCDIGSGRTRADSRLGAYDGRERTGEVERRQAARAEIAGAIARTADFAHGDRRSAMTVYLDTSNLVKLYVDEPDAGELQQSVAEADVVATSVLAYAEARAAFARRRREKLMTAAEARSAVKQLDEDWPRFVVIVLGDELGRAAGRLADVHGVRGCDAVHLASFEALVACCDDADVRFSCADDRLSRAARSLG